MVSSFVGLLEERYADRLDEDAREFIAYAVDGAERMKRLIDDLLSYSRVGRTGDREYEAVDCGGVLEEVTGSLRVLLEETGTRVTHDELPTVRGNRVELSRLFQNLIANAAVHGSSDGEGVNIHVSSEPSGRRHRITFRDDGPGIPPEDQERIFDVFQRLEPASEAEGTGMGLAISRKIVEHHGGRIRVESEPGEGAAFHVELPTAGVRQGSAGTVKRSEP